MLNLYYLVTALFFFCKFGAFGWFGDYNWLCEPLDKSSSPKAIEVIENC